MADHDDQISSNRRRLFKALSAAPVVMTLRPGSAAASSAYQCAANIRTDLTLDPGPVVAGSAPDNFVYENLSYWTLTEANRETTGANGNGALVSLEGTSLAGNLPLTVVSMNADAPASGPFLVLKEDNLDSPLNGSPFAGQFTDGFFSVDSGTLTLTVWNDKDKIAFQLGSTLGGFAVIVATGSVDNVPDSTLVLPSKTYPEADLYKVNGAAAGEPQGITGTCLGSFTIASTGSYRNLSIG